MTQLDTRPLSPAPAARPDEAKRHPLSWMADLADVVLALLRPIAVPLLRIALGVVYVWFGILKVLGLSPVADLVASMVPFVPSNVAVVGMGVAEVVLGLALIAGFLVPWIAAAQVLHLLGTFAVFVVHPEVAFTGNPFVVTLEGEFIAKNLVLVTALLVVAAHTKPRTKKAPAPITW